jgi:hypothetical protein
MGREVDPILFSRAEEQLRQERETFDQLKSHDGWWFFLAISAGFTAVIALVVIMIFAIYVMTYYDQFPTTVVSFASAALFADVLGLVVMIWKVVVNPRAEKMLAPVTKQ